MWFVANMLPNGKIKKAPHFTGKLLTG